MQSRRLRPWLLMMPLSLLAALAIPACRRETESRQLDESTQVARHLRALGYVHWDENPDLRRRGVTRFDPERTAEGYNLYTNDVSEVYLMDLEGRRLHTWRVPLRWFIRPERHCEYAELLADEQLAVVCGDQGLVILDRDSRPVRELRGRVHHDVAALPDGGFLVPHLVPLVRYQGRKVLFDGIWRVSSRDQILDTWSTWDQLEALKGHHAPSDLDTPPGPSHEPSGRYEYYHLNSVEILPETELGRRDSRFQAGNWLVCLRNANLVAILDRADRSVVWSWGPGVLDLPHMPTMLENGHLLVFDNGSSRGFSRVLELDPLSEEIVWSYHADPPEEFFSRWRGGIQRLANGNTLITESDRGRVFEVTPAGEIVWEFWNPEIVDGKRKVIYRLHRLPRYRVEAFLRP